ncbi:unnamed protein product [Paramecium pentaurelia]|uniref:Uncharacterized protein n=1 Tax=Paramecium pentaurelia TaxID=43138 RepID=A0A8S1XHA3_9CILI|nr:unnamed protein product [Paramecium pentaurelia]
MNGAYMANGLILLNLFGDVLYIIEQRLRAQGIDKEKGLTVLNDLAIKIYTYPNLQKIFTPAKTLSNNEIFQQVDQVVHCSIMKLNEDSLSKLFDLVIMTLKSYVMKSNSPYEIYLCTLRHFDVIQEIGINDQAIQAVLQCKQTFIDKYSKLSSFEYMMIRGEIMKLLGGKFTRVQMFLNDKSQNQDGTFQQRSYGLSGYGVGQPGVIRMLKIPEKYNVVLAVSSQFKENKSTNPFQGKCNLGENIFQNKESQQQNKSQSILSTQNFYKTDSLDSQSSKFQTQSLNHLAQLIQAKPIDQQEDINLFYKPTAIKQNIDNQQQSQLINQNQPQQQSQILKQNIIQSFDDTNNNLQSHLLQNDQEEEEEDEIDLLTLMDKAAQK